MSEKVLVHWLNFPEVIFLDFLRSFFMTQEFLVGGLPNNFRWDPNNPDKFPIGLSDSYDGDSLDRMPKITYQSTGWIIAGITIRQERHLNIDLTDRVKTDLIQGTGSIQCTSSERAESLLMAAIITRLICVGDEELKNQGFNKIEKPQISAPIFQEGGSKPKRYITNVNLTFSYPFEFQVREVGVTLRDFITKLYIGNTQNKYMLSQVTIG